MLEQAEQTRALPHRHARILALVMELAAVLGALIWFTWERIPADAKATSAPLEASAPVG